MKREPSCVIGVDYGSLSARAVILRVRDGTVLSESESVYPGRILTKSLPDGTQLPEGFVLVDAMDYWTVLPGLIQDALRKAGILPEQIAAIGVDATSCTVVPCDGHGVPLSYFYPSVPHAYAKLWKHHGVSAQADHLRETALRRGEEFLSRYGGEVSCEWMLPKVMQIYEEAPELFEKAACCLDLCDWLTWCLTGTRSRCANSAGFKGLWSSDTGEISREFLDALYPGFGRAYMEKVLDGPVRMTGECCGRLSASAAQLLGLPAGVAVATGMMDGHASLIALGLHRSGEAAVIIGTSNAIPFLSDRFCPVPGVTGIVKDGIIPGFYAYAAGQIATGDMLDWFLKNSVPPSVWEEAGTAGLSVHELLSQKAQAGRPECCPVSVLDWWNGNRSILCDQNLTGTIWGLTLETKPEELYTAMLQGIACGTRVILDQCEQSGLAFCSVTACGGIPRKNPFFMQQYANLLGRSIRVADSSNTSAIGSAICAAAAAGKADGGWGDLHEAMDAMCIREFLTYEPCGEHTADYERLYRRYRRLYDLLGGWNRPISSESI